VTIVELMVVVIIVSILTSLALVNFSVNAEKSLDREAVAALRTLHSAQSRHYAEKDAYYPASGSIADNGLINDNLQVSLPEGASRKWNYAVWSNGCARATRNGGNGRSWYITVDEADETPNIGAGCP